MRWRLPLFVHLSVVFVALLATAFTLLGLHAGYQNRRTALIAAEKISRPTLETISLEVRRLLGTASQTANLMAASRLADVDDDVEHVAALPLMARALEAAPALSSIYVGRDDGSFFLVVAVRRIDGDLPVQAPAETAYALREVRPAGPEREPDLWRFFDAELRPLGPSVLNPSSFDPRNRPWYLRAGSDPRPRFTDAYEFANGTVGTSASRRNEAAGAVVGVDMPLTRLSALLRAQRLTPGTELALVDPQRQIFASSREGIGLGPVELSGIPVVAALARHDSARTEEFFDLQADGRSWKATVRQAVSENGRSVDILLAVPVDEMLAEIDAIHIASSRIALAIGLGAIAVVFLLSWLASRRLKRLNTGVGKMRALQFDGDFSARSGISEVDALAETLDSMQATIRQLLQIGRMLIEERDMERACARLLNKTVAASGATRGSLVLADRDNRTLRLMQAADPSGPADWTVLRHEPLAEGPVHRALRERRTIVVAPDGNDADKALGAMFGEGRLVIVPLFDHSGTAEGAVCLALPPEAHVGDDLLRFVEALCGYSAVAIETARLMQSQKDLLSGFIRVIATAIDAKSAYTGAHCQRVPELTMALAAAAERSKAPAFADFHLDGQQSEELRLAAWLHDCGKVTTPEWVVDKATRLECVRNRIHEIRARFEILWRDAEIVELQEARAGLAGAAERRGTAHRALIEDFGFVAECNLGSTVMDADRLGRLREIADRRWIRHFDDRLGLSADELARQGERASPQAEEKLLDDKPSHRIPQPGVVPDYLAAGFKAAAPSYAFDFGELHNLSVRHGTLTAEERFKINEHVMQTILMLRSLPMPSGLSHVPDIAGAHHEHLDGGGYPRGLAAGELSISQRILAVADIFEALTAADRPYRSATTATEALVIMQDMVRRGHLDGDLVDLLDQSGIAAAHTERLAGRGRGAAVLVTGAAASG
jgi:HD-GYP domain-containing protein (c-di-GMP phosphodiesterase class II)